MLVSNYTLRRFSQMYTHLYVKCIHIYMYVKCIHMYTQCIHMYTQMYTHLNVYTFICIHTQMYTHLYVYLVKCIYSGYECINKVYNIYYVGHIVRDGVWLLFPKIGSDGMFLPEDVVDGWNKLQKSRPGISALRGPALGPSPARPAARASI